MALPDVSSVRSRHCGHVQYLTIDRPERRNAIDRVTRAALVRAFIAANADPDTWTVVVTGAGDRSFCAGRDLKELDETARSGGTVVTPMEEPERNLHEVVLETYKPTIAALNGPCAGAGFVLACFADFRISVADNRITPSFAGLGLPAEYGLAWTLTRIVGQQNALEILLANPVMSGDEAKQFGFVRSSVPAEEFARHVHEFARNLAWHSSPSSLKVMKRQVYLDAWADLEVAYARAVEDMNRMVGEPDFSTGLQATRDRRRARFLPCDDEGK